MFLPPATTVKARRVWGLSVSRRRGVLCDAPRVCGEPRFLLFRPRPLTTNSSWSIEVADHPHLPAGRDVCRCSSCRGVAAVAAASMVPWRVAVGPYARDEMDTESARASRLEAAHQAASGARARCAGQRKVPRPSGDQQRKTRLALAGRRPEPPYCRSESGGHRLRPGTGTAAPNRRGRRGRVLRTSGWLGCTIVWPPGTGAAPGCALADLFGTGAEGRRHAAGARLCARASCDGC